VELGACSCKVLESLCNDMHVGWCSKYGAAALGLFALLVYVSHLSSRFHQMGAGYMPQRSARHSRAATWHCWDSKPVATQCAANCAVHCSVNRNLLPGALAPQLGQLCSSISWRCLRMHIGHQACR
jgi:hypothetical protein